MQIQAAIADTSVDNNPINSPLSNGLTGNNNVANCTQEAKICPDGTPVGRVPPDCQFEPCPTDSTTTNDIGNVTIESGLNSNSESGDSR